MLLLCITFHQNLDAGFHVSSIQQGIQGWKAAKKHSFTEDNFILRLLLRFSTVEEQARPLICR